MKHEHYQFVTEYLRWGDQVIAYRNAYHSDSSYQTLESAANRLLKRPDVAQAIEEAQAAIRQQVEAEVAEQLKGELLTIQKKRELLYKIATGEMMAEQNYKGKDCNVCTQFVRPTITQMLRAIDLDSKLSNHYPQAKSLGNTSQQNPSPVPEPVPQETNKNSPPVIRRGDTQTPASVCYRGGLLANINRQHISLQEGARKTLKAPPPPRKKQKHEKTQQITTIGNLKTVVEKQQMHDLKYKGDKE